VEHGKPLIFGKAKNRGLRLKPGTIDLEIVTLGEGGVTEKDVLVHDERNRTMAALLAAMEPPEFPMATGVIYCNPGTPYESEVAAQAEAARKSGKVPDLNALLRSGRTWTVAG